MKVVLSPEAAQQLEDQVQYIRDQHAPNAAERLKQRVMLFLNSNLSRFPRIGRKTATETGEIWEVWIPRTRLIVWYEIQDDRIAILTVWHAAQNRSRD